MKKWRKIGQIYIPDGKERHPKLLTHAANPLPVHIEDDIYRIFYSSRDRQKRSSVGAVDIDIIRRQIIRDYQDPFFQHGSTGSFFADGVSIGNCYIVNGIRYMLFMGWQTPTAGHWRGEIGRLIVTSDLYLELESNVPIMGLNATDPISLSYPWVIGNSSSGFEMWYGSTLTWDAGNNEMLHVINHATSMDGDHWERKGLAVPFELGKAQAFSRASVVENYDGGYDMWFSYRSGSGERYRIGYAQKQAKNEPWILGLDKAGIDISPTGWDSEMIEYPFVFDHKEQRYIIYNGNGYGLTGFGLGILDNG